MGCDIHMYLEWRVADDAPWQLLTEVKCAWCHGTGKSTYGIGDSDCYSCKGTGDDNLREETEQHGDENPYTWMDGGNVYAGRNYVLFAILAGVRNDGTGFSPLFDADDRGIPADASEGWMKLADNSDYHSHTWLDYDEVCAAVIHGEGWWQEQGLRDPATKIAPTNYLSLYCHAFVAWTVKGVMEPLVDKYGSKNVRLVFAFDN